MRALMAACALAFSPSPAIPQVAEQSPIPIVICKQIFGYTAGSAFRIGPHLLLSVKHVTNAKNCAIDGKPINAVYTSPTADFSMLSDARTGRWLGVDCGGFVKGRKYVAIGHARALPELTAVPMIGTGFKSGGMAILVGVFTAQPGQSGGAIIDVETMKAVGTVNAADWERGLTLSVELKSTSVCGGHLA